MKRKKKKFDKAAEARRIARKSAPAPCATRIIPDKRKKTPKHKRDPLHESDAL
jgi:hypothetical protein